MTTCPHCRQTRTNCAAPDACAVCGCPECCSADFDARSFCLGAEAMRARILAGIRRWWSRAGKVAGHRFPGHPHWLDSAVAAIDAKELLASRQQLAGVHGVQSEQRSDAEHGGGTRGSNDASTQVP